MFLITMQKKTFWKDYKSGLGLILQRIQDLGQTGQRGGEGKRSTVLKPTDLKDKIFSKQKKCFYKFDHKQQFFDLSTDMSFICSEFVVPFRLQNNEEHLRGRPYMTSWSQGGGGQ